MFTATGRKEIAKECRIFLRSNERLGRAIRQRTSKQTNAPYEMGAASFNDLRMRRESKGRREREGQRNEAQVGAIVSYKRRPCSRHPKTDTQQRTSNTRQIHRLDPSVCCAAEHNGCMGPSYCETPDEHILHAHNQEIHALPLPCHAGHMRRQPAATIHLASSWCLTWIQKRADDLCLQTRQGLLKKKEQGLVHQNGAIILRG